MLIVQQRIVFNMNMKKYYIAKKVKIVQKLVCKVFLQKVIKFKHLTVIFVLKHVNNLPYKQIY